MPQSISTIITNGVVLSGTNDNPTEVTSTGYVGNTTTAHNGNAIYGIAGTSWTVTNYGTIKGNTTLGTSAGIDLQSGGDVVNDLDGRISGQANGVEIFGGNGVVLNRQGAISGQLGYGVYLAAGGAVTNGQSGSAAALISGPSDGVFIIGTTGTTGTVSNYGTITGAGFDGVQLYRSGNVTNGAGAVISGGTNGIAIQHTGGSVSNLGTISGGSEDGVVLTGDGNVTNSATAALISGAGAAITISGVGTVSNLGTILGGTPFAVVLSGGGSVSNGATGATAALISGGIGVALGAAGAVANYGTIRGTASGTGQGVVLPGGSVTNGAADSTAASISGDLYGIVIQNSAGTVANFGTVSSGTAGYGIALQAGGNITNGASGSTIATIEGGHFGVLITGGTSDDTVTNFGEIRATSGTGVDLANGGSVVNFGFVRELFGTAGDGIHIHGGLSSGVTNGAGAGIAGEGIGVIMNGFDATVSNLGSIFGFNGDGAVLTDGGSIGNSGTIFGFGTYGIRLAEGGSVTNGASGATAAEITGQQGGIYISGAAGTVSNFGLISGIGFPAVGVRMTNDGSITNGASGSTAAYIFGRQDGVDLEFIGTIANFGTIDGQEGNGIHLGFGSVFNGANGTTDAAIIGAVDGVYIRDGGSTVTNDGIIMGGSAGSGVTLGGGIVTVGRYGLVSGGIGIAIGNQASTVTDSGVVGGSGGVAIQFGTLNDTLILDPSARLFGKADGSSGSNTLELRAAAATGTLTGLGTKYLNFTRVVVDPGASWTIEVGATTASQAISGSGGSSRLVFDTTGTIDLSGVSGFPTIVLDGPGANTTSLANINFIGLASTQITVTGGDFGNTIDASALTGANRVVLNGGFRADTLSGGGGNDVLNGGAGNDSLTGGAGNDVLNGGAGNDTMAGGGGNDTYVVNSTGDIVSEAASAGTDTVKTTLSSYTLGSNVENLIFIGAGNFAGTGNTLANVITGGGGNDTLKGGGGNDTLNGGAGSDTMAGGSGNDTYIVDTIGDVVTEAASAGTDTVRTNLSSYTLGANIENLTYTGSGNFTGTGNSLNNAITGGAGADTLNGGGGNDTLKGLAGNDTLKGGTGNDKLTGGTGKDSFLFNTALNATTNVDHIFDFSSVDDKILLSHSVFAAAGGLGTLASGAFHTGSAAADADDRIVYNSSNGALIYDSNGNAAGGATQFATLSTGVALTHNNFTIV